MIRPHSDNYRPPRDPRDPLLTGVVVVFGAFVVIAGLVWLAIRLASWLTSSS
jgi:hypothetical protein